MDELCEVLTWAQLQIHHKPVAVWNVEGYYDSFLAFADHAVQEGLLKTRDRDRLLVAGSLGELLAAMESFQPVHELVPAKLRG
jgi:predicted Rossmann-fold nucleotide-binding protein